jgi:nucleoside-diphosphate-sugar epimerase
MTARKNYVPPVQWIVTGGLGVIASRFIDRIALQGQRAVIIDPSTDPWSEWTHTRLLQAYPGQIDVWRRDVQDMTSAEWNELFRLSAAVLHAPTFPDATLRLLEAVQGCPGKQRPATVIASSVAPYKLDGLKDNLSSGKLGVTEEWPTEPNDLSAASDLEQSGYALAYARSYNLPITVLRCSTFYGEGPCPPWHSTEWLTWACVQAALGWPITIAGKGEQATDVLYCEDVAYAIELGRHHISAMQGQLYNLGAGIDNVISVQDAAHAITQLALSRGQQIEIRYAPARQHEDQLFVTDTTKFRNVTGWTSKVTPQRGIRKVFDWAFEHRDELRAIYAEYAP